MRKVLLFIILATSGSMTFAQHRIFMEILENKKICNKEDQLTYFLQAKSFERRNEEHYYHYYSAGGNAYTTCIINQNECYVIYQTNNKKDFNEIKATITGMCPIEYARDKSVSYVCNTKRIQDVQVIFAGYSQAEKMYEIMVYQNPENHELPYSQADRQRPDEDKSLLVKKEKRKKKKSIHTTAASKPQQETAKTVVPATKSAPVVSNVTPAPGKKTTTIVKGTTTKAPSVMK